MNPTTPSRLHPDRRTFLGSLLCVPFAGSWPSRTLWLPRGDARTLVVLELAGGNDGLATVVPTDDAEYARLRPTLSAVRKGAVALGGGFALHGSLAQLAARVTAGSGAVVHGVGYDQPDRSHFRSRDIWHTADPRHEQRRADTTGWLGRAADILAAAGAGMPAAGIGGLEVPLALCSRHVVVPSLQRAEDFTLQTAAGDGDAGRRALADVAAGSEGAAQGSAAAAERSAAAFAAATATAAVAQAETLRQGLQRYSGKADYPESELGKALQLCARLATAGFGTRLFHLAFSGFDTHAQQVATHGALLLQLDRALAAFLQDLDGHGRLGDTVVLVHSEFGRRALENRSLGTDHGAAGPVLLFGGGVRAGLHGTPPCLTDLLDGDVRPTTDFRTVYAELLRWLGIDGGAVLGAGVAPLPLLPA